MLKGLFVDKPVYRKFLILVGIVLLFAIVLSMVAGLLASAMYGVEILNNPEALNDLENPSVVAALKLLQMISTGIGMFLVPSLIAAFLFSRNPVRYLSLNSRVRPVVLLSTILVMFAAVPLINLMMSFNQQLHLPGFLSGVEDWMKKSEESAARITEVFLRIDSPGELLYNLFIIAVLPALGEEFLFRGVLQRLFHDLTKNVHVTIWITAVIFSAIHMQFYGFLPRMALGVLFGYLLWWTGNIWIPVTAHLINNGAAVVFSYIAGLNALPFNQDTVGTSTDELPLIISSVVIVSGLVFFIYKNSGNAGDIYMEQDENVSEKEIPDGL